MTLVHLHIINGTRTCPMFTVYKVRVCRSFYGKLMLNYWILLDILYGTFHFKSFNIQHPKFLTLLRHMKGIYILWAIIQRLVDSDAIFKCRLTECIFWSRWRPHLQPYKVMWCNHNFWLISWGIIMLRRYFVFRHSQQINLRSLPIMIILILSWSNRMWKHSTPHPTLKMQKGALPNLSFYVHFCFINGSNIMGIYLYKIWTYWCLKRFL